MNLSWCHNTDDSLRSHGIAGLSKCLSDDCVYYETIGNISGNYTVGTNITLNLREDVYLEPLQQIAITYRVQIMPNIDDATNNASVGYVDPESAEYTGGDKYEIFIGPPGIDDFTNCSTPDGKCNIVIKNDTITISLHEGWNLISVPLKPEDDDYDLFSVLSSISGKYTDVYTFTTDWQFRSLMGTTWAGNLYTIKPGRGYWINMKQEADLVIKGKKIKEKSISLHEGWNLIGLQSTDDANITDALASISGSYTDIYTFTTEWIYTAQSTHNPDVWLGSLKELEPGRGYWINMRQEADVEI